MSTDSQRVIFTKGMKKDYTILAPQMLPIHFELLEAVMQSSGYNVEILKTDHPMIVEEGLKNVHNDTCYPALLVIGQLIDAVKSGQYDTNKVALMITQTGGGCRASNYIHLLRKALIKADLGHVPVISLSVSKLEVDPGFKMTIPMIKMLNAAVLLGDLLMWCANYKRAYEIEVGQSDQVLSKLIKKYVTIFKSVKKVKAKTLNKYFTETVNCFDQIEQTNQEKPKAGVVGEIYVKFAPLGNNDLEKFLHKEGFQVVVPGLYDFIIFQIDNQVTDAKLYGGSILKKWLNLYLYKLLRKWQNKMITALKSSRTLPHFSGYEYLKKVVVDYVGLGNKMGEGWLLVAEILELLHLGVDNIVCAQPFGCLPNHIIGKGMIKKIKEKNPLANIVPIDYDPGASRVNQENRIKLMLANVKRDK